MKFSIRDLFWATLVAAMAFGWLCYWRSTNARHQAVVRHAEKLRAVLNVAKAQCEELSKDADFFNEHRRNPTPYTMYFSHANYSVDWSVLDEPVP